MADDEMIRTQLTGMNAFDPLCFIVLLNFCLYLEIMNEERPCPTVRKIWNIGHYAMACMVINLLKV